jgi:hypothetical protein
LPVVLSGVKLYLILFYFKKLASHKEKQNKGTEENFWTKVEVTGGGERKLQNKGTEENFGQKMK